MAESAELRLLRQYLKDSGVDHRVTSTTGGKHSPGSYHHRAGTEGPGLAMDVAGPVPSKDSPALAAVYRALEPLGVHCAELIYSGPGGGFWKHGKKVAPYAAAMHHGHVHVALPKGTFVRYPKDEAPVPENTRIQVNAPVTGIAVTPSGNGYILVCADGGVFAFGDARFLGNVEYPLKPGETWLPLLP